MNKKTRIDFQIAAFNRRPPRWVVRRCSICHYPLNYQFCDNHERVAFDSGCDCTRSTNINECSWDRLADFYNMQTNESVIKEMNEFWGFDEPKLL